MKKISQKFLHFTFLLLLQGLLACTESSKKEVPQTATEDTAVVYRDSKTTPAGDKVVGVKDGDTFVILQNGKSVTVRLQGVDAPEKKQAYGERSKQFASDLAFGKNVRLIKHDKDRYGRVVGTIILPDGRSVNEELVREGLAWHYTAYSKDTKLANLEADARRYKRGLWADSAPTAPWDYRKGKRSSSNIPATPVSADSNIKSNSTVWLCDSRGSDVYHVRKDCSGLNRCKSKIIATTKVKAEKEYNRRAAKDCQ